MPLVSNYEKGYFIATSIVKNLVINFHTMHNLDKSYELLNSLDMHIDFEAYYLELPTP